MKVMCHIGGVETRQLMSQILDLLRPGDILTHCYSGFPNLAGDFTNIVQDGKLLPAALAAKQRGVIFDVGHGGGSFDYTVAEAAIAQGTPPDTISSDIHAVSGNTPGMPYLTWVMSKFMGLGFTLEQVVAMATINPAKVINRAPKIGTLQMGAPGDVAIMELVEGPVSFVDTRNNKRDGKVYLLLMTRRRPRGVSDGFQRTAITGECPLWVKSRHCGIAIAMSALSPSQTFVGVSGMSA
jgi:dihydroorotase